MTFFIFCISDDVSENKNVLSEEESELAYLTLRQCRRGTLNLDHKAIDLKEKMGEWRKHWKMSLF